MVSEGYFSKLICLLIEQEGSKFLTKPYLYQLHLWQILNAFLLFKDKRVLLNTVIFTLKLVYFRPLLKQKDKKEFLAALAPSTSGIVTFFQNSLARQDLELS